MIGTSSTAALRTVVNRAAHHPPSAPFSTTPTLLRNRMTIGERNNRIASFAKRQNRPSVQSKRKVDDGDESLSVDQAARVLRAIEISRPSSSYNLKIDTQPERAKNKKKKAHIAPLRGRVVLPVDFRPTADKILVFALPGSADFRIAQAAGVDYVGGAELFTQLIDGEIEPDKVLSSTNMIGPVTSTLARFLGPKGLMPTARRGLVGDGEMLANIIREAKGGLDWRADDDGRIDMIIGRANQSVEVITANVRAFLGSVREAKKAQTSLGKNADEQSIISTVLHGKTKTTNTTVPASLQSTWGPLIKLSEYN